MTRPEYSEGPSMGGAATGGVCDGDDDDEGSVEEYEDEDGENMNPLTTLLRLAKSSDYHDGEVVIRSLHETLQYVIDSPKDIKTVLDVIASLSTSNEPILRTDLMEQVPQIAFLCHDHPDKLGHLVAENLIPMVVKFLTDAHDMVRKTSQAALLVLLEQELVSHKEVHDQVCPIVLDLTEPDAIDYFKTEAVALMSKMAPLVGREMTEKLFLHRFTRLCSDTLFQVRKVCAANFGEMSGVVGMEGTENVLLSYFLNLCEDGVWGVRKACADVFMAVSCACCLETRKTRLAPLFVSLLSDDSRWVRLAAFQNLGPFISTFADPNATGLQYIHGFLIVDQAEEHVSSSKLDEDSVINSDNCQRGEKRSACGKKSLFTEEVNVCEVFFGEEQENNENLGLLFETSPFSSDTLNEGELRIGGNDDNTLEEAKSFTVESENSVRLKSSEISNDDPSYNELNYWRIPLPDIDLNLLADLHLEKDSVGSDEDGNEGGLEEMPTEEAPEVINNTSAIAVDEEEGFLKSHHDDLQAVLEVTAASLAEESIFCTESRSEAKSEDMFETKPDVIATKSDPLQTNQSHSQSSAFSLSPLVEPCSNVSTFEPTESSTEFSESSLAAYDLELQDISSHKSDIVKRCSLLIKGMHELADKDSDEAKTSNESSDEETKDKPLTENSEEEESLDKHWDEISAEIHKDPNEEKSKNVEHSELEIQEDYSSEKVKSTCDEGSTFPHRDEVSTFSHDRDEGSTLPHDRDEGSTFPHRDEGSTFPHDRDEGSTLPHDRDEGSTFPHDRDEEESTFPHDRDEESTFPHDRDEGSTFLHDRDEEESTAPPNDNDEEEEAIVSSEEKENYILGQCNYSRSNLSFSNLSFSNLTALPSDSNRSNLSKMKLRGRCRYEDELSMFQSIHINVNQDIVPKMLLEHYISMTDPVRAETVDDEITRHCAYSLPAVALTLGRRYWSVLRGTYETLATDMHWKVRRTLAFSIHELALILGEDLAQKDLLPVFEGFIKDLDEVRIGVLKHLALFLKWLPPEQRKLFLPRLSEFLNPDNVNNWRFRLELALQLAPISEMFSPEECWTHICPITFDLMSDKVVEIRRTCFCVISQLAKQLYTDDETSTSYIGPFSQRLIEDFAEADTWTKRQSYAYVVGQIIKDAALPPHMICILFLPKFLELARDKVPNIRLVVARIINADILTLDSSQSKLMDSVRDTLYMLKHDQDRDVQYFASMFGRTRIVEAHDAMFY